MSAIYSLAVVVILLFLTPSNGIAATRSDEPGCSRCGDTKLIGLGDLQPEVFCALGRLGCVDWSSGPDADLAYGRVQRLLRNRGFLEATVGPGEAPGDVKIRLGRGYLVERLEIVGNETVDDKVVRSVIIVSEGDPFNRDYLDASIRNINDLGLFEAMSPDDAVVTVDANSRTVRIVFNVRERPLRKGPPN